MARHKEKDAEAGGEGLGLLATRKRLWRDDNGNIIVGRRQRKENAEAAKRQKAASDEVQASNQGKASTDNVTPLSPPTSTGSGGPMPTDHGVDSRFLQDSWPAMDMNFIPQSGTTDLDFLSNSSWGNQSYQTFMGAPSDLPYDDIFKPDTGMFIAHPNL